jgi:hypothetical protein
MSEAQIPESARARRDSVAVGGRIATQKGGLAPDFVIVGAPKCGTTSLYTYLATHPQISMASQKEPFFWSPDVVNRGMVTDPQRYAALWDGAAPDALRGEASADYILSERAIPDLLRSRPDI